VNNQFMFHPKVQCRIGFRTCDPSGSFSAACHGEVLPSVEVCDGIDNNCNGVVDEGCPGGGQTICSSNSDCTAGNTCQSGVCAVDTSCTPGFQVACYTGPAATRGVGACTDGIKACDASGAWGACTGDVVPTPEVCGDGIDNDCNGLVDANDPACAAVCTDADGDGYAIEGGACGPIDCNDADAAVNPGATEICTDGIDNNCNGLTDGYDPACVLACNDGNPCTVDSFDPASASCVYSPAPVTTICGTCNPPFNTGGCTTVCDGAGNCAGANPCDDGNLCTIDTGTTGACVHTPVSLGTSCNDPFNTYPAMACNGAGSCLQAAGTSCTSSAQCASGVCSGSFGFNYCQ